MTFLAAWVNNLSGSYGTIQNSALWSKVSYYGVTRLYLDARYAQPSDIDYIHGRGVEAGVFRAYSWTSWVTAAQFAAFLDGDLARAGADKKQCAVLANIEYPIHDSAWIIDWITAWRNLHPSRVTAWSPEGMQGGWASPALVAKINADPNLQVVPQPYDGAMNPWAQDEVWRDIVSRGVNPNRVWLFYDGKTPLRFWQGGYVFTLERMPPPSLLHHARRLAGKLRAKLALAA